MYNQSTFLLLRGPGLTILFLSWTITLYTLWQMVEMHEMIPGKRFDRYHELGQHAFGEKLGLYIVVPQQLIVEVGGDIVYMVTGGASLRKFHNTVCPSCKNIKLTYFIMIFASAQFVLSHLPNLNSISGVSLVAAVMSIWYIDIFLFSILLFRLNYVFRIMQISHYFTHFILVHVENVQFFITNINQLGFCFLNEENKFSMLI